MLKLPTSGISRSVVVHNCDLSIVCDWIEACVIFDEKEVSTTDVVDVLLEDDVYDEQDFAREFLSIVWEELRRRAKLVSSPIGLQIQAQRVTCGDDWTADPAYSYCLALSLASAFPDWKDAFGHDYTQQGALFEDLTVEALEKLFPLWKVHKTGWSPKQPAKLAGVVDDVVQKLYEVRGAEIARWLGTAANEEGLDVLLYREFPDTIAGFPLFLLQCASGTLWEDKLNAPNLGVWKNIVSFASVPVKALAIPHALDADVLRQACVKVQGPLFDRYRLLGARTAGAAWPSEALQERLWDWMWPRVTALPRVDW